MHSCQEENNQTQYNALGYRINLCFHGYNIAIKVDESRGSDRNIDHEKKTKSNRTRTSLWVY